MRTFAYALVTIALLTTACGPSEVPLDSRPSDEGSARDLAFSIAGEANCEKFEDFEVNSSNRWAFTCGASGHTFEIEVFSDTGGRDAATRRLRDARAPFRAGAFFVVSSDGDVSPSARNALAAFPGDISG